MAGTWEQFADGVLGLAGDYVRSGGVSIAVKTNFGPEIKLASSSIAPSGAPGGGGGDGGGGVLDLLGVRAAVVVRDRSGKRIAGYGDYPATEPLRVVGLVVVVALIGVVFVRGLTR